MFNHHVILVIHLSIAFLTVVGMWTGVAALSRSGKNGPWQTMFTGAVLITVAKLCSVYIHFFGLRGLPGTKAQWFEVTPVMEISGGVLFFLGFAIHAIWLAAGGGRFSQK